MSAIDLIRIERERQINEEGFDAKHDDDHDGGDLARAAAVYAAPGPIFERHGDDSNVTFADPFPFERAFDKRPYIDDEQAQMAVRYDGVKIIYRQTLPARIRMLVKAGALIAAEIDRLQRFAEYELESNR